MTEAQDSGPMFDETGPKSQTTTGLDGNDAELCSLLANQIDRKPDHDGKADVLTAYALRMLAERIWKELQGFGG